ncbi:tyrosine-type recombinase/integrase [Bradyrhizobium diazoefficiens]|uniref:tyrosine-type recombinase/integrase n=1 Tax=Bradyrhizobium diazoefficiens TaxID=1355477 RepID=UPI001B783103|nr:integrase [Bradyrhizobium japonicum]
MHEIVRQHRFKMVRFESGEHFPLLLDRHGLPLWQAVSYFADKRGLALSTLDAKLRTIAMVHGFLAARSIDLKARLSDGRVLEHDEAAALTSYLRTVGPRTEKTITRRRAEDQHASRGLIVEGQEWLRRRLCAIDYLRWLAGRMRSTLQLSLVARAAVDNELAKAKIWIADGRKPRPRPSQPALSVQETIVLLEAIRPGSATNPFLPSDQFRNFALVYTYWETGLRRSEPLGLIDEDLSPDGTPPSLKLVRRPHDRRDARARRPGLKTMPRTVPITPILHAILFEYITRHRRLIELSLRERGDKDALRQFKSNPYIFVSGRGTPLSLSAVYNVFDNLRMRVAGLPVDLSPHALRRTWNDLFSELRSEKLGPKEVELREFLMGWVRGSSQSASYRRRWTEREASQAIIEMQRDLIERTKA